MAQSTNPDSDATPTEPGRYQNETLKRAFVILECLDETGRGLSAAEVARRTGLHRATVHRFLTNLTEMGYTRREPVRNTFWIGFKMAHFGLKPRIVNRIAHAARPIMRGLAIRLGCTVALGSLEGAHVLMNEVTAGPDAPAVGIAAGDYVQAAGSALGRALMALGSDAEALRRCRLSRAGAASTAAAQALVRELSQARASGHGMAMEEAGVAGLRALAVPLINPAGRATCALALLGSARHLPLGQDVAHARLLTEAAAALVAALVATAPVTAAPVAAAPVAARVRGSAKG